MSDYAFRVMNGMLASELVPASIRTRLMRAAGFPISKSTTIWAGANIRSRKIVTGEQVFINVGFYHDGYDLLTIGSRVKVGPFLRVVTAAHSVGPSTQRGSIEVSGKPVRIGNGCWIGAGVTLLPGVEVADGCIVATGAVLHESTEPDGLYAGNPAQRVRDLEG